MDWVTVVLAAMHFALIGWIVHIIMGMHGGLLHWAFIGGCGSGIGATLEWITGYYTRTFLGAIGLCIICSCVTEYAIRRIRKKLDEKHIHNCGFLTADDVGGNIDNWEIFE